MSSAEQNNVDSKPIIIVYHDKCLDGAGSAWVIARALRLEDAGKNRNIKYLPYEHSKIAEDEKIILETITPGTTVYFVDVAPNEDFLDKVMSADKKGAAKLQAIHILDHHESSANRLKNYAPKDNYKNMPELNININPAKPSATAMIWDILLPDEEMPEVVKMIDKMDLSSGLQNSEDFAAAAYIDSYDVSSISSAFKSLRSLAAMSFEEMAAKGVHIKKAQQQKIDKLLTSVGYTKMQLLPNTDYVDVPIVNGNVRDFGRLISGYLVKLGKTSGSNVTFSWFEQKNGAVTMSLRSDGNPDLSEVVSYLCEAFGVTGGGHKDSAAVHFSSSEEFFRHIVIKGSRDGKNKSEIKCSNLPKNG